ncbi:MAG: hypothetical protein Q9186_000714 [Xanthomendoza sp. 1 TL-2023]
MNVQHTFDNVYPQQDTSSVLGKGRKHGKTKKKKKQKTQVETPSSPSAPKTAPQSSKNHPTAPMEDFLALYVQKLPRSLLDKIKGFLLEMVLCPGYYVPQIPSQTHNIALDNSKCDIARPQLLRLSQDIYRRYVQRLWTKNIIVIKVHDKFIQMIPVDGHLHDSYGYLINVSKKDFPSLEGQLTKKREAALSTAGDTDTFEEREDTSLSTPKAKELGEKQHNESSTVLRHFFRNIHSTKIIIEHTFLSADVHDSSGSWEGYSLNDDWLLSTTQVSTSRRESVAILWKAFTMITKRRANFHEVSRPELAGRWKEVRVEVIMVRNKVFVFI